MSNTQSMSADVVHSDAAGNRVRFYGANGNRSGRDQFYAFNSASVRIGPYHGYRSLQEAIDGIARNDLREAA